MKSVALLRLSTMLFVLMLAGCRSPFYSDRGAAVGGLGGAGLGAAIGSQSGHPLAGAAIGAAAGALTGNAIGHSIDRDIERNNALIEQQMGRRLAGAVTMPDVISMSQSGLGEDVIITHIRANGVAQPPQVNDLIALKGQGVSDRVINALQQSPPPQLHPYPPPGRPPVIVEEIYYGGYDPWCRPGCRPYYRPPCGPPGVTWGFSYGH